MNIAEALLLHARQRASRPALVAGDRCLTYAGLERAVAGWAGALARQGIGRGTVVGLALRDDIEHVLALWALAWLGAVILPIDWRWTGPERARIRAAFGAGRVLSDAARGEPGEIVADAGFHACVLVQAGIAPPPVAQGDPPLVIALSSGTTGDPKGPVIRHSHMRARFLGHYVSLGFNETDRFLCATPLYHGGGRGFVMSCLYGGATAALFPPPWEPPALSAEIARLGINSMFLVPTQLRRCLAATDRAEAGPEGPLWPTLSTLVSTGSALSVAERLAIRRRLSPHLRDYYGSTEGGGATVLQPEDMAREADSVGRPSFGVELEVVDPAGRRCPPGTEGSVRWRGPGVPVDDEAAPGVRGGWFYPGDRGRIDANGFLRLAGRDVALIIRGGVNINPAEVEAALRLCPGVSDAAVIGVPSPELGEEVGACIVADAAITAEAIIAECRARLAHYKIPRRIRFVAELPRNAGGKVILARLREMLAQ